MISVNIVPRTVINLDEENKEWLDQQAALRRVPMTELVRQAVRDFRFREQSKPSLREALDRTAGIWRGGDGLEYQRLMREEWR